MKHYDALTPVVEFNNIGGNTRDYRKLNDSSIDMQMSLIDEEVNDELKTAMHNGSIIDILDACADSIVVIAGLIHKLGYDPNEVMKAVNNSNLSKYCYSEDDAVQSVNEYSTDKRYSKVHYLKQNGAYVVLGEKSDSDGWKILKGINYVPAEVEIEKMIHPVHTKLEV